MSELAIDLPKGWSALPPADGVSEYRPRADGSTGILQLSRFPAHQVPMLAGAPSLAEIAEQLGIGLGARGQNWGRSAGRKGGDCRMGRYGFALFQGGEFPAMLLWVTASSDAAFLWTWLGPSVAAPEVAEAVGIVLGARLSAG